VTASPDGHGWEPLLRALAEAQARTEERLGDLTAAQARAEERLGELTAAQARAEEQLASLAAHMQTLTDEVGDLKGGTWELHYRNRAHSYLSGILRRIHVLAPEQLAPLLDGGVAGGRLTEEEADEIERADLICGGLSKNENQSRYLVVEISAGVGPSDVKRAVRRADLLARLGTPALPVVAGQRITPEAREMAEELSVWLVTDGRTVAPP